MVKIIQGLTGCGCVGIKVLNGKEEKPYESYAGFSREFWKRENL